MTASLKVQVYVPPLVIVWALSASGVMTEVSQGSSITTVKLMVSEKLCAGTSLLSVMALVSTSA